MSKEILIKPDIIVTRYCGPNHEMRYQINRYQPTLKDWGYITISERDALDMAIAILQAYIGE